MDFYNLWKGRSAVNVQVGKYPLDQELGATNWSKQELESMQAAQRRYNTFGDTTAEASPILLNREWIDMPHWHALAGKLVEQRADKPDTATHKIEKPIEDMSLDDYRRGVACVFDSFRLLP
jgi:hypothetical protein